MNDFHLEDQTSSSASPSDAQSTTASCSNCGSEGVESFCPACGQPATTLHQPVRQFLAEAVGNALSLDSRLWRTLGPLFTQPGELTASYNRGHRARYVPPLRLFLFSSFIAFLALGLLWTAEGGHGGPLTINAPEGGMAALPPDEAVLLEEALVKMHPVKRFLVVRALLPILEDPRRAQAEAARRLPVALLFLVPLFATTNRILYRKRERFFVPHLVFSLYFHSFAPITTVVAKTIDVVAGSSIASLIALVILLPYLVVALRRAFGGGWLVTILKVCVLLVAYLPAMLAAFLVVAAITGVLIEPFPASPLPLPGSPSSP